MITIRKAAGDEGVVLADVYVKAARSAYQALMPPVITCDFTVEYQQTYWVKRLSQLAYEHFVAEVGGEVRGFVRIGPATTGPNNPGNLGEVHLLFVDPAASRQGVGKALLKTAEQWLAEAGYQGAVLWVFSANLAARQFYEHVGWKPVPRTERWSPNLLDKGVRVRDCQYWQSLRDGAISTTRYPSKLITP